MAKGKSTYSFIAEALMKTPEAQKYKETIASILDAGFDHDYVYFEHHETTQPTVRANFVSKMNPGIKINAWNESWRSTTGGTEIYVYISFENLIDKKSLEYIFNSNWGVPKRPGSKKFKVPTYGLKSDECLKKWQDHFTTVLNNELASKQHAVGYAEGKKIKAFLESPECREGRQEYRNRTMVESVKKAILKYKDITEDIIRRACDEACCALVMED